MNLSKSDLAHIRHLLEAGAPLEAPDRQFVKQWRGGQDPVDGCRSMPFPEYFEDVDSFFDAAQGSWWSAQIEGSVQVSQLIEDDDYIATATLAQIKALLTFCARGERFCDGHREALLKSGRVSAILRRLRAIHQSALDQGRTSQVSRRHRTSDEPGA